MGIDENRRALVTGASSGNRARPEGAHGVLGDRGRRRPGVAAAASDSIPAALGRYESLRRGRTAGIQLGSRRNAGVFHMRPPRSWLRNVAMRSGRFPGGATEALYAYDALAAAQPAPPGAGEEIDIVPTSG